MWSKTAFANLTDIHFPIIQAPMAGITSPELVAEVSNAGCLGSIGAGYLTARELKKQIRQTKKLTSFPFAVNVFAFEDKPVSIVRKQAMHSILKPVYDQLGLKQKKLPSVPTSELSKQLEVIITEKVPVVSFVFGCLDASWIDRLQAEKITVIGTATCKEEAKLLEKMGVDAVCLQGMEAGGHRSTFIGREEDFLIPLDQLVSDAYALCNVPLIAAGGIMTAEHIKHFLELGASAVQMGTAFLTTKEAATTPIYKKVLLMQKDLSTILTRAFTGKLARALPNAFTDYMEKHLFQIVEFPTQHYLTKDIRDFAKKKNDPNFLSLWAGVNHKDCKDCTVAELIAGLLEKLNT